LIGGTVIRDPEGWARLGRAIRGERDRYGWTRAQLAKAAGVSTRAVQDAESGRVPIKRWPQTVAAVEVSLGWHPGSAQAILEGGAPQSPPFPLEIKLLENAMRRSCEVEDGRVAAEAGITISDWWRLISSVYPPVRAPAKTLAHLAYALGVDEAELAVVGRADAAEELRALGFKLMEQAPVLSEDDPRFRALLAIMGTLAEEERDEALRLLGWKIPRDAEYEYLIELIGDAVKHQQERPE
jgi:helix-turn-helix protein